MRTIRRLLLGMILAASAAGSLHAEMELAMIEQPGCNWCARWNAEIAPIYPKTTEALVAPLRRLQLHAPLPDNVTLARPAVFTPTFILLVDGVEVSRIEGYPSADFFWGLLDEMIKKTGEPS